MSGGALFTTVPVYATAGTTAGGVVRTVPLAYGRTAQIDADGNAIVVGPKGLRRRIGPLFPIVTAKTPDVVVAQEAERFADQPALPYAANAVVVAFRTGVSPATKRIDVAPSALSKPGEPAAFTSDRATNVLLAKLGVDRQQPLFGSANAVAARTSAGAAVDLTRVVRLHVVKASIDDAIAALRASGTVSYASHDWYVGSMRTSSVPLPANAPAPHGPSASLTASALPANYAVQNDGQSMLDAPGVDAIAAYDLIEKRFHQLPGQGEIITNVSVGNLQSGTDPTCNEVTTKVIGGQRYLDLPSMPLIPTYTADAFGALDPLGTSCNQDAYLGEVGLDFSVMAPLPHDRQRPSAMGSGYGDLLGIAPGAQYRLVVPGGSSPTFTDIGAAFIGAASQSPRPNVITMSLGFGVDAVGFPSRYLEEDPILQSMVAAVVNEGIVVVIASGDGTRTFTPVAIGSSGGSVPIDRTTANPSTIEDDAYSTIPSTVVDSGAFAAGGTTLNDISAAPPSNPAFARLASQQAFPTVRTDGFAAYSSGFGSRVDLSAPGDGIIAYFVGYGGIPALGITGGTSAAAPEIAAASAVVQQVARLTGHATGPKQIRSVLVATARAVPAVPHIDRPIEVGPQIDIAGAVEALAGRAPGASVARVAVAQRRSLTPLGISSDTVFETGTDRTNIALQNSGVDVNLGAYLTIAPDWEGVPANAGYRLSVKGSRTVLAATRSARLLPQQIFAAAGLPTASGAPRTVTLTYAALSGARVLASTDVALTFSPSGDKPVGLPAPNVAPAVSGSSLDIPYDLTNRVDSGGVPAASQQPVMVVSHGGRPNLNLYDSCGFNNCSGRDINIAYVAPLSGLRGTVHVPLSALDGAGLYGAAIAFGTSYRVLGNTGYFRVLPNGPAARPVAPLLRDAATPFATYGHFASLPATHQLSVQWSVANVPGATGATLEVSDEGPSVWLFLNNFNNPNGSRRDHDGDNSGSVAYVPLPGVSGTMSLSPSELGLSASMYHDIRVLATNGATVLGEAGDVSSVQFHGLQTPDGGSVGPSGFAIDPLGTIGAFASTQQAATGQLVSGLWLFDQRALVTGALVASGGTPDGFTYASNATFGTFGGYAVSEAAQTSATSQSATYGAFQPAAEAAALASFSSAIVPLSAKPFVAAVAGDRTQTKAFALTTTVRPAIYSNFLGNIFLPSNASSLGSVSVSLLDLASGSSSGSVNLDALLGPATSTNLGMITAMTGDPQSQIAYVASVNAVQGPDDLTGCGSDLTISKVDMKSGTVSKFATIPHGSITVDAGYDPARHKMFLLANGLQCLLPQTLYTVDLATGNITSKQFPTFSPFAIAVDPVHGRLVAMAVLRYPLQDWNGGFGYVVLDESGNVLGQQKFINDRLVAAVSTLFKPIVQIDGSGDFIYTAGFETNEIVRRKI